VLFELSRCKYVRVALVNAVSLQDDFLTAYTPCTDLIPTVSCERKPNAAAAAGAAPAAAGAAVAAVILLVRSSSLRCRTCTASPPSVITASNKPGLGFKLFSKPFLNPQARPWPG
jgi:hypothetical protein